MRSIDGALPMDEEALQMIAAAADMLEDIAGGKVNQTVLESLYAHLTAKLRAAANKISENERRSGLTDRRTEPREPAETTAGDDLVRVSQDRIDSLIKAAGEMVINRSTLQQHLTSLDGRMHNLGNVVERLRIVSSRLEMNMNLPG